MANKRGRPRKSIPPQDIQEATIISETKNKPAAPVNTEASTPPPAGDSHANFSEKTAETLNQAPPPPANPPSNNDWDPVTTEPVINRGYGTAQAAPTNAMPGAPSMPDIPEPRHNIPTAETILNEPQPGAQAIPPNPGMNDLSSGDKRKAAEAAVEFIFTIWQWLNDFARKKACIDMKEVQKLHDAAKIDMNMLIPRPGKAPISFKDVVEDFNNQSQELFIVTEKFKNEVREPMIREFLKRNIGLTDLQKIAAYWSMEGVQKIAQFIQTKNLGNEILQGLMDLKAQGDKKNRPATPPPAPASAPPPEPQKPPAGPADAPIASASEFTEPEERRTEDKK